MASRAAVLSVLLLVVAAGCDKPETEIDPATTSTPSTGAAAHAPGNGAIEGRVVAKNGTGIGEVTVAIKRDIFEETTNTTATGAFAFSDVPPGLYLLQTQKLAYDSSSQSVNVSDGEVERLEIVIDLLSTDPGLPTQLDLYGIRTHGGWFQVPYAEAMKRVPAGFDVKPHVVADPNDQTAEYAVYVTKVRNGTLDGATAFGAGFWAFEVLNVDAPSPHGSSATVEFVPIRSYATDPAFRSLLNTWGLVTHEATISFDPGDLSASTTHGVSSVKHAAGQYQLQTANSQGQETLTGSTLTVRVFAIANGTVTGYVDLSIGPVLYSLSGASAIDTPSALGMAPTAPAGEAYAQWGDAAIQRMVYSAAKPAT